VVLGLQKATCGTKDTVAGYNGTKATQATTVNEVTKGYARYYGYESNDGTEAMNDTMV